MRINFPLYVMRAWSLKFTEGKYLVLQTNRARYVLDYIEKELTYSKRRLQLLADVNKPYNLYPLKLRIETVSQIVASGKKEFIDADGNIIKWKPTTFHPLVCILISSRWVTSSGSMGIEIKGTGSKFIVTNGHYKYAQVIQIKNGQNILYDLCDDYREPTKRKI
jgi:hypothetical protein